MKFGVSDGAEASDSGHHQPELGTPSEGDPHSPLEVERHPHPQPTRHHGDKPGDNIPADIPPTMTDQGGVDIPPGFGRHPSLQYQNTGPHQQGTQTVPLE